MSVFIYSEDEEPVVLFGPYKAILKKKLEEKLGRSLTDSEFWDEIYRKENSDVWDCIAGEAKNDKYNMDDGER